MCADRCELEDDNSGCKRAEPQTYQRNRMKYSAFSVIVIVVALLMVFYPAREGDTKLRAVGPAGLSGESNMKRVRLHQGPPMEIANGATSMNQISVTTNEEDQADDEDDTDQNFWTRQLHPSFPVPPKRGKYEHPLGKSRGRGRSQNTPSQESQSSNSQQRESNQVFKKAKGLKPERKRIFKKGNNRFLLGHMSTPWTNRRTSLFEEEIEPRTYLFESVRDLMVGYGLRMSPSDSYIESAIEGQFKSEICSAAVADKAKQVCHKELEIMKCTTCSPDEGTWYSAVSQGGAISGRVEETLDVQFQTGKKYTQLDVLCPFSGDIDKLSSFVSRLGKAIRKHRDAAYGQDIDIRLLVTLYPSEGWRQDKAETEAFRQHLTKESSIERIVFVDVNYASFHRAQAINALHKKACSENDCVVTVVDVDMDISPSYLRNVLTFVHPGTTAYFPIVWSEFNPETVELAEKFYATKGLVLPMFSPHKGTWRQFGFGMYAISGADAARVTLDETYSGWGGEDNDFYSRVSGELNVVRMHEHGLVHIWHPKVCTPGDYVEASNLNACVGSMAAAEGSSLGMYLRDIESKKTVEFDTLMNENAAAQEQQSTYLSKGSSKDSSRPKNTILVAIVSSRKNFKARAAAISKSWGKAEEVPEGISIRFFLGASDEYDGVPGDGSGADKMRLAKEAGIANTKFIEVMPEVRDEEYPPVRKNSAMIKRLDGMVREKEEQTPGDGYEWIFKVDDDAYVNLRALRKFVSSRDASGYSFFGQRGIGREEDRDGLAEGGLMKPYCMGGPGYILSRPALRETAAGMDACVERAASSPMRRYLWHSDAVIGMCVQRRTGAGCWDGNDYYREGPFPFHHRHEGAGDFAGDSELAMTVSVHPLKEEETMLRHHESLLAIGH